MNLFTFSSALMDVFRVRYDNETIKMVLFCGIPSKIVVIKTRQNNGTGKHIHRAQSASFPLSMILHRGCGMMENLNMT
jgi:hypothetical protein